MLWSSSTVARHRIGSEIFRQRRRLLYGKAVAGRHLIEAMPGSDPSVVVAMAAAAVVTASLSMVGGKEEDGDDQRQQSGGENGTTDLMRIFADRLSSLNVTKLVTPAAVDGSEINGKKLLHRKYHVGWNRPLGEGAFGAVYRAYERSTEDMVAVKKIGKKYTDDEAFRREMDALNGIRRAGGHPNICQLREHYEDKKDYYLVLDLVEGGEMFEQLSKSGAYSEADAARFVREVASALAFMHGIGIVHGDLKPENLMLSSNSPLSAVTKIVDFGCAQLTRDEDEMDLTGAPTATDCECDIANTPAYCPPEVIQAKRRRQQQEHQEQQENDEQHRRYTIENKEGDSNLRNESGTASLDPSFDMWSLGVILYIMLTGVHPFDSDGSATDDQIEDRLLSRNKPPLNDKNTGHLSEDALAVIGKLMEWDPAKRWSALELLDDAWVRGETARTQKMADSDKRLAAFRDFKTKLGATVFKHMVSFGSTDDATSSGAAVVENKALSVNNSDVAARTSLIERSFHALDPERRGYVTAKDLVPANNYGEQDLKDQKEQEQLSLSGFSDLLAENMKNRYFPRGHTIYHEGDEGNVMYFINSGTIEICTSGGLTKTLRKQGDFFGEGALMHPDRLRSATIRCVTPVHVIEVSREYFEKYLAAEQGCKLEIREKDKARKRQRAKAVLTMQRNMRPVELRRGEHCFRVGDKAEELYILEEGDVHITVNGHTVVALRPGEMTGEQSLIFGRPRNVDVVCRSPTAKLHALRKADFDALLAANPSLRESVRDICLRREFQKALCVRCKQCFPKTEQELQQAWAAIDRNGRGWISLEEIREMINEFDPTYSEPDFRAILNSLALSDPGRVTFDEYKSIFGMDATGGAKTEESNSTTTSNGKSQSKRKHTSFADKIFSLYLR